MSEGLPSVGAHCSLSSCNLNDFLPIRCQCQQLFCRIHIAPDVHHCPTQQVSQSIGDSSLKLQRCAVQECNKPSLESFIANPTDTANRSPAVCSGCGQAYCALHREQSSHACTLPPSTSMDPVPGKNAAAKALLAKHFGPATTFAGTSITTRTTTKALNPKKEAQQRQIAAMKMRHKAQPGDPKDTAASVPMDQRLHLKVSRTGAEAERIFWFKKTIMTGRALDMLAHHFKMTISDTQPLNLLLVDGEAGGTALRTDQALGAQVSDGSSLTLSR